MGVRSRPVARRLEGSHHTLAMLVACLIAGHSYWEVQCAQPADLNQFLDSVATDGAYEPDLALLNFPLRFPWTW